MRAAREALNEGDALVFDRHRVAICCAAVGKVSPRRAPRARLADSADFRQLGDGPLVYAHRRFTSNLPSDFGLPRGPGSSAL